MDLHPGWGGPGLLGVPPRHRGLGRLEGGNLNRPWRLLITPASGGAWNMALDEALAESVRAGGLPFLRFYTWSPGTLSLGRYQNPEVGLSGEAREVPRVRRLTGGGGIWHADELTYSLGCTPDDLGISGVKPSFEKLCGFLLDTWRSLGWEAGFARDALAPVGSLGKVTAACFAGQEEYDILVGGRKLGGNAQRRDRNTVFQHGSIPVRLDHRTLGTLFQPGFQPDPGSVTDLGACGWTAPPEGLIPLLASSFQARMGGTLGETSPSAAELDRAGELERSRYGDPGWTENGGGTLRPS